MQAILIAAAFEESWPLLIVCPSTLRQMWENSLKEWLPESLRRGMQIAHISGAKVCCRLYESTESNFPFSKVCVGMMHRLKTRMQCHMQVYRETTSAG